jgi:hypothetical protein
MNSTVYNRESKTDVIKSWQFQKSYLSRVTVFAAIFAACIVFAGCNDDEDDPTITRITATGVEISAERNNQITQVHLVTENNAGTVIHASGNWSNRGFTIDLPEIAASHLRSADTYFNPTDGPRPATIFVSNSNARVMSPWLEGHDADGKFVNEFRLGKVDGNTFTLVEYYYVDSDVKITGSYTSPNGRYIYEYSLDLKKGWNVTYYTETITIQSDGWVRNSKFSSSAVSGLSWYCNSIFWSLWDYD